MEIYILYIETDGRLSNKCNSMVEENFSRRFPAKALSGSVVNKVHNKIHISLVNAVKIKPFRKEEA